MAMKISIHRAVAAAALTLPFVVGCDNGSDVSDQNRAFTKAPATTTDVGPAGADLIPGRSGEARRHSDGKDGPGPGDKIPDSDVGASGGKTTPTP
jgi:hypothetical protein